MKYPWTIVMKNGNKYIIKTEQNNITDMLESNYPKPNHENSFSVFLLSTSINNQNFVLLRYSEISEILWSGSEGQTSIS